MSCHLLNYHLFIIIYSVEGWIIKYQQPEKYQRPENELGSSPWCRESLLDLNLGNPQPGWQTDLANLELSKNLAALEKCQEISWKLQKIWGKEGNFGHKEWILQELPSTQFQFYFHRTIFTTFCLIYFISKYKSVAILFQNIKTNLKYRKFKTISSETLENLRQSLKKFQNIWMF